MFTICSSAVARRADLTVHPCTWISFLGCSAPAAKLRRRGLSAGVFFRNGRDLAPVVFHFSLLAMHTTNF